MTDITDEEFEENTRKMKDAIAAVNDKLKLNVPLDIDVKYGTAYSDVH